MLLIALTSVLVLIIGWSLAIGIKMNKTGLFKLPPYLTTRGLRFKIKAYYITGTILNSIFYKEYSAQKAMLVDFRKLGKVSIIGRDEAQRIVIKLLFSPQATCIVLLYPFNGWLIEQNSITGKSEKYFEKFNLPWYLGGSVEELATAVQRTPTDNLLLKL